MKKALFLRPDFDGNYRNSTAGFRERRRKAFRPVRVGYGDYSIAVFDDWNAVFVSPIIWTQKGKREVIPLIHSKEQYLPVHFNRALPSKNIELTPHNRLIVKQSGDYEITFNLLVAAAEKVNVGFAVRVNRQIIPQLYDSQTLTSDPDAAITCNARLSGSSIVHLKGKDEIDLSLAILRALPECFKLIVNGYVNHQKIRRGLLNRA